jgi:hypothetical protein
VFLLKKDFQNNDIFEKIKSRFNKGPKLNITDVRLANGTGPFDGRAEIKVNDTWGTICDNNFNINDADTFCNMLGLK